jgi:hypothetical protein
MGTCTSRVVPSHEALDSKSKGIEDLLMKTIEEERRVIRCLLLGAGECGKSTILKQMKIINSLGFTPKDFKFYKRLSYNNTIEAIQQLANAMKQLSLKYGTDENKARAVEILTIDIDNEPQLHLKDDIHELWMDIGVQKAVERANEYSLLDSASYFLSKENIDRVFTNEFNPTQQDILRCRLATTGINQTDFIIDK